MQMDWFDEHKAELEDAYFGKKVDGIVISHPVDKETENFIMGFLKKKEVNNYVYAWKAGTLKRDKDNRFICSKKNNNYLNGYGNLITTKDLDYYLSQVNSQFDVLDSFEDMYKQLLDLKPPKFLGAVYMINLLFFKSGGEWSIYDRFAHKAAKAIYMECRPDRIYVGEAPSKKRIDDVVNLYSEYIWLLEQLFGTKSIGRTEDRALWAYGHACYGNRR